MCHPEDPVRPFRRPARLRRAGTALILSLLFLTLFLSMGFALMNETTLSLRKAENLRSVQDSRMAAESGLVFMLRHLKEVRLPGDTTEATLIPTLQTVLAQRLNGTGNLDGAAVQNTGAAVFVPQIEVDGGGTFRSWVSSLGGDRCRLMVEGSAHGVSRCLTMDLILSRDTSLVFTYGLASRGQIQIAGGTTIVGVNKPSEANIFSATTSSGTAVLIDGNSAVISGDIFLTGGADSVSIGSPSIGGTSDPDAIWDHIHCDMPPPDFPVVNTAPLAALATGQVVDPSTNTAASGQVYNNIRIAAGTNPNFASNVVLNGVVYIESPNVVTFDGHATVNAIIVTEDKDDPLEDCRIRFAGTVEPNGVEALPDTPEFAAVKQHTGTYIVAPGFRVVFEGNFATINGSIAADQIAFAGTSEGIIKGTIVGLADVPMTLEGNVSVSVDRSNIDDDPAGFLKPFGMHVIPDTYLEFTVVPG